VCKEQDLETSNECKKFPIPIQIDWSTVIFPKEREYVKEVRAVGKLVRKVILNNGMME
jgi:hypothetical protein